MKAMTGVLAALVLLCSLQTGFARERKESDSDVIYDENKIPHYSLPPLVLQ